MFQRLGAFASRHWVMMLAGWALVLAGMHFVAPPWEDVVEDGVFGYLPPDVPSRRAEALFAQAFSKDLLGSSVVIVVRRQSREKGLTTAEDEGADEQGRIEGYRNDFDFIESVLEPRLKRIERQTQLAAVYAEHVKSQGAVFEEISAELEGFPDEVASAAVADWHHDLFPTSPSGDDDGDPGGDEDGEAAGVANAVLHNDPDPETDSNTPLDVRLARGVAAAGVPISELRSELRGRIANAQAGASHDRWSRAEPISFENLPKPVITNIRTFADKGIGDLLKSKDGKATLVVAELASGFQEIRNRPAIHAIEDLFRSEKAGRETGETAGKLRDPARDKADRIPPGLDLQISGSAAIGRDMRLAAEKSVDATHFTTIVLVLVLLLIIYRAPLLVMIPMLTVAISVHLATEALATLTEAGFFSLFAGIKIYIVVVLYGAGVDYCMFLIARYKEELDAGVSIEEAIANSVGKVGAALAASAGTTMCGIGMLAFAQFRKLQMAGLAMSFSLFFVLLASVTFTPALLRLFGRWAFWPHLRRERVSGGSGWVSPTSLTAKLMEGEWLNGAWERIGRMLLARPATVWLVTVALLTPFVVVAVANYDNLSFVLLSELPQDEAPSVKGAEAAREHFPGGATGPVTILVHKPGMDFREPDGYEVIDEFTSRLMAHKDELEISDVRSVNSPLGYVRTDESDETGGGVLAGARKRSIRIRAFPYYVGERGEYDGEVTRIDVVFKDDPFTNKAIVAFERFREKVPAFVPEELQPDPGNASEPNASRTELLFLGSTPSVSDLKSVTNRDQVRVDVLVVVGVFLILVVLLKRVATAAYLVLSVFFSYLVTLGVTFVVFGALSPEGFAAFGGLDWKVPLFLFTILIAVGEDYNIYLITRVQEEQVQHGPVLGVTVALARTGAIISGCGVIMAGTFSSLAIGGSLVGIQQLGFALAFGVMLDTFVVRPILVPAYLILLHSGRFGVLGRLLGAQKNAARDWSEDASSPEPEVDWVAQKKGDRGDVVHR